MWAEEFCKFFLFLFSEGKSNIKQQYLDPKLVHKAVFQLHDQPGRSAIKM